jgi:preprotein translocase subunit SecG
MFQVIIIFHVLLGLSIIGLILMQQGKGADAGAAFGSGASGTVFGAQGAASFLSRATAILAILFFSTSLGLAVLSGQQDDTQDLMDVPEAEQKLLDVPVVFDSEASMTIPSIADQEILEDLPAIDEMPEQSADQPSATTEVVVPDTSSVQQPAQETAEQAISAEEIQEVQEVVPDDLDAVKE